VADFASVAAGIADKLERRHPHVFQAGTNPQAPDWEALKAVERGSKGVEGLLADIPAAMPALGRATKIGRRAAQSGFDWPDADGAHAKILEELREIDEARALADPALLQEEVGDLLMAVTSLARHLRVDPETALRQANRKFEARFARMESLALHRGLTFGKLTPEQQDELWRLAKRDVQS
jgi:nucleoside triphosphate diphosphatase